MKRLLPFAVLFAALLGALWLAHHQQVGTRPSAYPVLSAAADGQRSLTRVPARLDRLSDADEIRIGNALAAEYTDRLAAKPTPHQVEVEAYLQRVGTRTAARARRKLPYRFHYIPDPEFVNAFALPGGHVFVGEGLLRLMDSEDALAAVLGHEVEHIDLRHCADRIQTEAHLQQLDLFGPVGDLLSFPVEVFTAGYSKEEESEADRDGITLAVEAGYSPLGLLHLMHSFEALEDQAHNSPDSPVGEAAQLTLDSLSGYFASHPPATEREAQIQALIGENHWPTPPLKPLPRSIRSVPAG